MKSRTSLVSSGVLGLLCLALALFHGCKVKPAEHGSVHWSYSGETGPAHWGDLSPDYILCKTGKQQSPIDISGAKPSSGSIQFKYKATPLNVVNNGHAIQQDYEKGSMLEVGGQTYELKQFHIHSASEHTVEGKRYDMEIHLVHKNEQGVIVVVGVLLQQGQENAFLKRFWSRMPKKPDERVQDEGLEINIQDLLPGNRSCYVYDGSLTTPPCTEGVKWHVLSQPVDLSAEQLEEFRKIYKGTYRPVQPLNGRTILHFAQ